MFKTTGKDQKTGNYDVEQRCSKGHTFFKKRGDTNPYNCPYCNK